MRGEIELALTGGEDYELLFCIRPGYSERELTRPPGRSRCGESVESFAAAPRFHRPGPPTAIAQTGADSINSGSARPGCRCRCTQLLPPVVSALLFVSALLAASETALFALVRMEHTRGTLSASVTRALDRLMRRPVESLIVVIGLNEAANVCAECLATSMLLLWLGPIGAYVSVPVMFILVLLIADITPKTLALGFPGVVARITARPLAALADAVHPVTRIFTPVGQVPRPRRFRRANSRRCCGWAKARDRSSRRSAR